MSVIDKARLNGYRFSKEYIETNWPNANENHWNEIEKTVLNLDIRQRPLLESFFPPNINSLSNVNLEGSSLVQILSVSNIAQSSKQRSNESALPRLLSIVLTDGHTKVTAIEKEDVKNITSLTPPGTKLLLTACKIILGRILLENSNCVFLGGSVQQLLEAWQANLNAQRFRLSVSGGKNKSHSLSVGVALPPQFELSLSAAGKADSISRGNLQLPQKDIDRSISTANMKLSAHKESSKEVVSVKEPRVEPASIQREEDTSQRRHHHAHPRGRGGRGHRGDGDGEGRGAGHGDPNPSGGRGRGRHGRGRGRHSHSHSPADNRGVVSDHAPPPPSASNLLLDMNSLFPPLPG
eukprot:gene34750-46665_t